MTSAKGRQRDRRVLPVAWPVPIRFQHRSMRKHHNRTKTKNGPYIRLRQSTKNSSRLQDMIVMSQIQNFSTAYLKANAQNHGEKNHKSTCTLDTVCKWFLWKHLRKRQITSTTLEKGPKEKKIIISPHPRRKPQHIHSVSEGSQTSLSQDAEAHQLNSEPTFEKTQRLRKHKLVSRRLKTFTGVTTRAHFIVQKKTNGVAARAVRRMEEGTTVALVQHRLSWNNTGT